MSCVLPRGLSAAEAEQLKAALGRLEAHPLVSSVRCITSPKRVVCNLWCGRTHAPGPLKQPAVSLNSRPVTDVNAVPSYFVAAEKLLLKVNNEHASCHAAAEEAKAKAAGAGTSTFAACSAGAAAAPQLSAFFIMRKLEPFRNVCAHRCAMRCPRARVRAKRRRRRTSAT